MSSKGSFACTKRKSWMQILLKQHRKKKQKPHQKVQTTNQKRYRIKQSLEVAIGDKNLDKVNEILLKCFDLLQPEDMMDLIVKAIVADEQECQTPLPLSFLNTPEKPQTQTFLHAIMKYTKQSSQLDGKDRAPIHAAVKLKKIGATTYLLDRQPLDINLPTKSDFRSPLHLAASVGSEVMVGLLLERGAEPDSRDIYGNTPMHLAVQSDADSVVKVLLSVGYKTIDRCRYVNAGNNDGWTALHLAAHRGNATICRLLLESGANVDCRTKRGKTPLHWASLRNNKEVVALLVEHAADLEAVDASDRVPYEYAISKVVRDIIDVGDSKRSSKSGSIRSRRVSIRIDPRSRNYWHVSKGKENLQEVDKSSSIRNPQSTALMNSFISSIDVVPLPHGIKPNLSEPDLSHSIRSTSRHSAKSRQVPTSLTNSISSFRSFENSSRISEFYNQHARRHHFSGEESGIFEQSFKDDESSIGPCRTTPNECQSSYYKNLSSLTYDDLTSLYSQIKSTSGRKKAFDIRLNFHRQTPLLEMYTVEALPCIKNHGVAWLSICQKFFGENEASMFYVGKMAAIFQDEHKDRCLCQRCVEQLMLLISLFLLQGSALFQDHAHTSPVKKTCSFFTSLFPGFSKRAAYERFSEKISHLRMNKRNGGSTLGFLLEKIEEKRSKMNGAILAMAQHIKSFVAPDVWPKDFEFRPPHPLLVGSERYEQLSSNQLVDLIVIIIESGHEWILDCLL